MCAARRTGEEVDDGGSLPVELVEPQVRLDAVERADLEITRAANKEFSRSQSTKVTSNNRSDFNRRSPKGIITYDSI